MTAFPTSADVARAADLDAAHVAWSAFPAFGRGKFGVFAVNHLRERGLELVFADTITPPGPPRSADLRLPESPFVDQAIALGVEEVADLLAALAERGLRWLPGENGECGTLLDGMAEPPDLHVVFDCFRCAWQRDDDLAAVTGDPRKRWLGPNDRRSTWDDLQRVNGRLTPDGGIPPTTPAQDPTAP